MREGKTLILVQSRHLYESLLDALNVHYTKDRHNDGNLHRTMLSLAGVTQSVFVQPSFRCIVLEDRDQLDEVLPPFINRFSKVVLTYESALTRAQRLTKDEILDASEVMIGAFKYNLLTFLIPGLSADSLDSAVYSFRKDLVLGTLCGCFSVRNLRRLELKLVEELNADAVAASVSRWSQHWKTFDCHLGFESLAVQLLFGPQNLMCITEQVHLDATQLLATIRRILKSSWLRKKEEEEEEGGDEDEDEDKDEKKGEKEKDVRAKEKEKEEEGSDDDEDGKESENECAEVMEKDAWPEFSVLFPSQPIIQLNQSTSSLDVQNALISLEKTKTNEMGCSAIVFVLDATSEIQSVQLDSLIYSVYAADLDRRCHVIGIIVTSDQYSASVINRPKMKNLSLIFDSKWEYIFADEVVPRELYKGFSASNSSLVRLEEGSSLHEVLTSDLMHALVLKNFAGLARTFFIHCQTIRELFEHLWSSSLCVH